MNASDNFSPHVINVDKNAAYPKAVDDLKADHILSESFELRPVKYLNQQVEQDHRFIKRLVNPGMGYVDFNEREANFEGVRNQGYFILNLRVVWYNVSRL
jgi:transposase-like protein